VRPPWRRCNDGGGTDRHREGCDANSTQTLLFTDHPLLLSRHQICVLRSPRKVSRKATQYSMRRTPSDAVLKGGWFLPSPRGSGVAKGRAPLSHAKSVAAEIIQHRPTGNVTVFLSDGGYLDPDGFPGYPCLRSTRYPPSSTYSTSHDSVAFAALCPDTKLVSNDGHQVTVEQPSAPGHPEVAPTRLARTLWPGSHPCSAFLGA